MEITGRTALVTGGARRVGRAFSLGLATAGARVVVNYHTSSDEADEVVAEIRAGGGDAVAVRGDVADSGDRERLAAAAEEAFGGLDILVNSASVFHRIPFGETTEAQWDDIHAINVKAPYFLTQVCAPLLRRRNGVVVNICDLSALQAWPSYSAHAASKASLLHLTHVLARALAPDVRVNAISPGTILPPEDAEPEPGSERRAVPQEGQPQDAVAALLYLVRSDFVTGENLVVDGGRLLY